MSGTPRHTSFGSAWLVVMSTSRVALVTAPIAWIALRMRFEDDLLWLDPIRLDERQAVRELRPH
jgi:hypothetical protein